MPPRLLVSAVRWAVNPSMMSVSGESKSVLRMETSGAEMSGTPTWLSARLCDVCVYVNARGMLTGADRTHVSPQTRMPEQGISAASVGLNHPPSTPAM